MNDQAGPSTPSPSTPPRSSAHSEEYASQNRDLQPHQQQNHQSSPPSPPDLASLDTNNVLTMIRRRRAGDQGNAPQARIYKKARMRTRNWSELRQRAQQQLDLVDNATPEPPNQLPEHAAMDVAQALVPDLQDAPAVANLPMPADEPTIEHVLHASLPRDHLLLLVPPLPHHLDHQTTIST